MYKMFTVALFIIEKCKMNKMFNKESHSTFLLKTLILCGCLKMHFKNIWWFRIVSQKEYYAIIFEKHTSKEQWNGWISTI